MSGVAGCIWLDPSVAATIKDEQLGLATSWPRQNACFRCCMTQERWNFSEVLLTPAILLKQNMSGNETILHKQ
jgi:hypothetical protein